MQRGQEMNARKRGSSMRGRIAAFWKTGIGFMAVCFAAFLLTGCSRERMNAQIAESIGTLGLYENNEPVETPKMKAEREMEANRQEAEKDVSAHLAKAARLAASYNYEEALAELDLIGESYQDDDRVISARIEYQRKQGAMVQFKGDIPHFSVKSLIVDTALAFDGDDMAYYYNNWALTAEEFQAILQSLYDQGYLLIDVHELVVNVENEDGTTSYAVNMPLIPKDKKPMIFSFAEANYYDHQIGNGFSERMVLDKDGHVQNEYTDASGETHTGAYDVVPIVDEFVEAHPDFSLRGAKGIISLTGYEGVFGYGVETGAGTIREIAKSLKDSGWQIACHSYSDASFETGMTYDELEKDMEEWDEKVGELVGQTDLLFYPYGEEVAQDTQKHELLMEEGYRFYFSIWSTVDFMEVKSDFVRQSRRTLDGYDLYLYGDSMADFFDAKSILDKNRYSFE